jgi:tetratricopeptide (TPR) repeat protein
VSEEALFELAVNAPEAERAALLDRECAGNPALRARLDALLAAHFATWPPREAPAGSADATGSYGPRAEPTHSFGSPPPPATTAPISEPADTTGALIAGRYKMLQQIGEGGMGSVWMAEQTEPVKRRVAVKLIRTERGASKAILARFEAERQAIALMDHPHIAKLLDAGTTEFGGPYFVMELVKGVPLNEFCDAQKLSIADRLQLFVQICSAVQHAHQKGVIHRDLKPGNILVESHDGKPVPKVIDFGLAKATSGLQLTEHTLFTAFGSVLGTPLYMAPEQAKFNAVDVDTRADIYALGVILYELLTGTTPLTRETLKKAPLDEMLKLIREQDPPTPSSRLSTSDSKPTVAANRQMEPARLGRFVKGELDWIVMKSLSKERDRRYESATGFARDIERFLNKEPVQAGPPGARYRIRKFVQRNRGQVVAAGLVLAALLVGIVGTTLGLIEAKRQEREAKRQEGIALDEAGRKESARLRTRGVLDTVTGEVLEPLLARERYLTPDEKDFLRRLLDQYREFAEEVGDDPNTRKAQVRALTRVGRIQQALGERAAAGETLRRAAALGGTATSPITDDPDGWRLVADAHSTLFKFYQDGRQFREAEPAGREAMAAEIRLRDADPAQHRHRFGVAVGHMNLAAVLGEQNRLDQSEREHRAAVAELELLVREFPHEDQYRSSLARELNNQAILSQKRRRFDDALTDNARAVEMQRQRLKEAPGRVGPLEGLGRALEVRAELLRAAGQPGEAEPVVREWIRIGGKLAEAFPSVPRYRVWLSVGYTALADALVLQGSVAPAAEEAKRAVAAARVLVNEFADDMAAGRALAAALLKQSVVSRANQSFPEADEAARSALAETDRLIRDFGKRYDLTGDRANALRCLASALRDQARYADAEAVLRDLIATLTGMARDNPEVDGPRDLVIARFDLAATLTRRRQIPAAEAELRAAAADIDRLPAAERENHRAVYLFEMAKLAVQAGKWKEAEEWSGQAVEVFARRWKENPNLEATRGFLAQCYWHRATARDRLGHAPEAAKDWGAAAELVQIPMDRAFYRAHRGASLARGGDAKGAAAEFAAAIRLAEAALKGDKVPGITFYDGAAVYALAAGAAADKEAGGKPGAEAVGLLRKAAAVGFFNDPAQRQALRTADEYAALHPREDFKNLLAELEKK